MADQSASTRFRDLFDDALRAYEKETCVTLANHSLAMKLQACDTVEAITALLQDQAKDFKKSEKITKSIVAIVSILTPLSSAASLPDAVGLPFPPSKAIQACLGVLLDVAKSVISSREALFNVLESIGHFVGRLRIYTEIPLSPAMVEIVVKIMMELIRILALETKKFTRRRLIKSMKRLLGDKEGSMDIEAVLLRLDRLTQYEHLNAAAQTLGVVSDVREGLNQMASDMNKSKRDQLLKDIRSWLSSPDPWKNYNSALELRHGKTGTWFVNSKLLSEWKDSGPSSLLWINGKPGAGKTVLCSAIIEDIETMQRSGLASLVIFYYDFREDQKKGLRGLLSSVLVQLGHQSDSYCDTLSKLRSEHENGSKDPSDTALIRCLKQLLELPRQAPTFLIVDALDECLNTPALSSPREKVLTLLQDLINLKLPNLRICVTSRPEVEIKAILDPLTFRSISLHDEHGQEEDIRNYIESVVNDDTKMQRWSSEQKKLVIKRLTERSNGMFQWVRCQLDYLAPCNPIRLERALNELPATLDETYERALRKIEDANWEDVRLLLQCIAVASRPLQVEELADILSFDFEAGPIPKCRKESRLTDPEAVLSMCPTLLSLVNVKGSQVLQFAHFSIKEFLTSTRFSEKRDMISRRYHISMTAAHTVMTQACLGILLDLDENITRDGLTEFPLAEYAAEHWFEHARVDGVSGSTIEGMKRLFDQMKPHFAVWLWICDPFAPTWMRTERGEKPFPPHGTPLHYAALCGICDVAKGLAIDPKDVNSQSFFDESTPLHLSSREGHVDIARFLLEHGANAAAQDERGSTPLHEASMNGHIDIARILVEHGANAAAQDQHGWTPLHKASWNGHLDIAQILVEHGANASAQDHLESTPLHSASWYGHLDIARFLVEHGANVAAQGQRGSTPLHGASMNGHLDIARFLVEYGANVAAQDQLGSTPLHSASWNGHLDIARFLVEHGANAVAQDQRGSTPLHSASEYGHLDISQFLVEHGGNAAVQDQRGSTPLHEASRNGHLDIAQFLVEHGANASAQDQNGSTPLHEASGKGRPDIARFLVEHGANVAAQDQSGSTPLHEASWSGHLDIARFLVEHGANVVAQNRRGSTPLHSASWYGHLYIARFLVEHGANAAAQDQDGLTPLHEASGTGHLDIARFLVEHGANVAAQDQDGSTPLHGASGNGHLDIARILVEHGANAAPQNQDGSTPLHLASGMGHLDIVRFLVEHGANAAAQDQNGLTPLHGASGNGHLDIARLLVEHGANPAAQNQRGLTPLRLASSNDHFHVEQFLVEHSANVATQATLQVQQSTTA